MGWGMAAAIGGSLLGNVLTNDSARSRAHDAQDFSAEQYATRWQTTVKDMQAAGLNPMLAYSQGVGSSPSGVQAPVSDYGESIGRGISAYNQVKMNSAQVANVEADTKNKEASADLIAGQAAQAWSTAAANSANVDLINANAKKVIEEIKNIPTEGKRLEQMFFLLRQQTKNASDENLNIVQQNGVIRATAQKIISEIGLNNLSLDASRQLDNIGNKAKELKPLIEIVKPILNLHK